MRTDFEEIQHAEERRDNGALRVTTMMIRTVYLEIKINIPFDSHKSIVQLQEMHGIKLGFHHREKCGSINMMESISLNMHKFLLQHMLSKQLPFSIIVDGSSDISDFHYLTIHFQILDDNIPVVVFYKLIELSVDVTGAGIYQSMKDAFQSEAVDFFKYFKENLVGYASDGEPTMSGQHNGVIAHIRRDVQRNIFAIHCMAHRLELSIKHALTKHPYFAKFEAFINELFQFYNNNALKRKAHLRQTAFDLNQRMYELNYIYHIRWIGSEYQSVLNLKKVWNVLVTSLSRIGDDRNFDTETRRTAKSLCKKILSKHFLIILNFITDILHHLSFWSHKMQEKTAMLVEFSDFKEKLIESFENLRINNGRDLAIFIGNVTSEVGGCSNVQDIYAFDDIKFAGWLLNNENVDNVPFLQDIRNIFLDAIINQIKSYFPTTDMKSFKIFRPKEFPDNAGIAITYGAFEIVRVCEILNLGECLELVKDWGNLVVSIVDSDNLCKFKSNPKTETYMFWSHFLNETGIVWTKRTQRLIQTILVLPIGSAEAERAFSVLNHIKNKRRSSLKPKHIQDIMRIRLNGPNELEKFPASRYANAFIKDNHIRTDDPRWKNSNKDTTLKNDAEDKQKKFLPCVSFL